jgi:hypothetical protein
MCALVADKPRLHACVLRHLQIRTVVPRLYSLKQDLRRDNCIENTWPPLNYIGNSLVKHHHVLLNNTAKEAWSIIWMKAKELTSGGIFVPFLVSSSAIDANNNRNIRVQVGYRFSRSWLSSKLLLFGIYSSLMQTVAASVTARRWSPSHTQFRIVHLFEFLV